MLTHQIKTDVLVCGGGARGVSAAIAAARASAKPVSVDIPLKGLRSLPSELLSKGAAIKRTATGVKFEMKGISHGIFKI